MSKAESFMAFEVLITQTHSLSVWRSKSWSVPRPIGFISGTIFRSSTVKSTFFHVIRDANTLFINTCAYDAPDIPVASSATKSTE